MPGGGRGGWKCLQDWSWALLVQPGKACLAKQVPAAWKTAKRTCALQCYFAACCLHSSENTSTRSDSDSFSLLAARLVCSGCLAHASQGQLAQRASPFSSPILQPPWDTVSVGAPSIGTTARGDRACARAGPPGLWQELGLVQEMEHQNMRILGGVTGIATLQGDKLLSCVA